MPSDVVAQRIKDLRKSRRWSLEDLAEQCSEKAGADQLTANAIENIEHGRRDKDRRRRRMITVDELLVFAVALDVAPVHLLVPTEDDEAPYRITPKNGVRRGRARAWIRGLFPLPSTDERVYFSEVPRSEWVPPGPPADASRP